MCGRSQRGAFLLRCHTIQLVLLAIRAGRLWVLANASASDCFVAKGSTL